MTQTESCFLCVDQALQVTQKLMPSFFAEGHIRENIEWHNISLPIVGIVLNIAKRQKF